MVIGRVADAVLATDFSNGQTRFTLTQYPNNLAFLKLGLSHLQRNGSLYFQLVHHLGGGYAKAFRRRIALLAQQQLPSRFLKHQLYRRQEQGAQSGN